MKENKNKVIIVGGGGNSRVIIDICQNLENLNIIGYTDIEDKGLVNGIPFIGNEDQIDLKNRKVVVGISYLDTPKRRNFRIKLIQNLSRRGCIFPNIISNSALLSKTVKLGFGTLIYEKVIINNNVKIGNHCIINTSSLVEHDCLIGDNFFLGPKSIVCGNVEIGNNVFIGAGSVIVDEIKIHDNITIGAGSVVTKSLEKEGLYFGNPARIYEK